MSALLSFLALAWAGSGALVAARMDREVGAVPGIAALVTLGPVMAGGLALLLARAL